MIDLTSIIVCDLFVSTHCSLIADAGPLSQRSTHAEQYAQTKTNSNPNPDPNRYYSRCCPDPNARIQKFIHYMAIAAICDSGPLR